MSGQEFIPHDYQEPIREELKNSKRFGIFAFPGSGKTVLSLDKVYQHKKPTLIICPLDVMYTTWFNEHKKWDFSQNLKYTILHGPKKEARFLLKRGIYFINPEGLKWLVTMITKHKRFPWDMLIVDESIKFKNHKSVQFQQLCKMLTGFEYRFILSGNPVPNHYLNIWAQVYILDEGKRLGKSWYGFRNKYFQPTDYMRFNWEIKPGAKEEIVEAIGDITYFLESDDSKLPKRIINNVIMDLPPDAKKVYKQMELRLFAEIDDSTVLAMNAGSAGMKCWQIANGFLYESEEREHPVTGEIQNVRIRTHFIHTELQQASEIIVRELDGDPVLIAYHFAEDRERLKDTFPNAFSVDSSCKPERIREAERAWNNNEIKILLVHIQKFSHGLNLQLGKGHHILMYSMTYNYDTFDQLIRRFQRQGAQFANVIVHRLIMKDTIHEAIVMNLDRKHDESHDFLMALKEYRDSVILGNN